MNTTNCLRNFNGVVFSVFRLKQKLRLSFLPYYISKTMKKCRAGFNWIIGLLLFAIKVVTIVSCIDDSH